MSQIDWVGGAAKPAFRDIRNQRESKAARKAELCLEIGRLCSKVPPPRSEWRRGCGAALESGARASHSHSRQRAVERDRAGAGREEHGNLLAITGLR